MEAVKDVVQQNIQVPILTDLPLDSEIAKEAVAITSRIIQAAMSGNLTSVICTHEAENYKANILCITARDPDSNTVSYAPVCVVFDGANTSWTKYSPPNATIQLP